MFLHHIPLICLFYFKCIFNCIQMPFYNAPLSQCLMLCKVLWIALLLKCAIQINLPRLAFNFVTWHDNRCLYRQEKSECLWRGESEDHCSFPGCDHEWKGRWLMTKHCLLTMPSGTVTNKVLMCCTVHWSLQLKWGNLKWCILSPTPTIQWA